MVSVFLVHLLVGFFLGSPGVFGVPGEADALGHGDQRAGHLSRSEICVLLRPGCLVNGNHHSAIGAGNLVGHVIRGNALASVFAMRGADRRLDDAQDVVNHQAHAESEQGRLGIARRFDFAIEVFPPSLEKRFRLSNGCHTHRQSSPASPSAGDSSGCESPSRRRESGSYKWTVMRQQFALPAAHLRDDRSDSPGRFLHHGPRHTGSIPPSLS